MFLNIVLLMMIIMFFYLWGDYMKIMIFLEIMSLLFVVFLIFVMKCDMLSMNFFFGCLIFLVCESSMGFLLFIFYISMESEVVKKLTLIQF